MSDQGDHVQRYLEYFRWVERNPTTGAPLHIQVLFDEMVELIEESSVSEVALIIAMLLDACDEDGWRSFVLAGPICDFLWSHSLAEVNELVERMERVSPRAVELVRRYPYVAEVLNEEP
jgi:hypothetical protein